MRSIWMAAALFVAGLSIIVLRPMFLADGAEASVYSGGPTILTWIGWVLLLVGGVMVALSLVRSRRNDRS